ncbi:MAG: hypothetical protein IJH91_05690, partial [Mogibacterium sp.]|nr:hypothetical protein [Mogibacterium sp.]
FEENGTYVSDLSSLTKVDAGEYTIYVKGTNPNYQGEATTTAKLTITQRNVTLTSADDTKVYDGAALTNDEVTVGGDGWASGEGATYNVTGSQTNVGSSANTFAYTLSEATKAANYNITMEEGTLTVTPVTTKVTVTITEHSGTAKYDGTEKTVTGYDVSIDNELYTEADFTFSGDATITGTNAGTYQMQLKASDFTNTSKNFTNVEFVIVDGTLEISKRDVTLTSATDEKVYDGTPLTNSNVTVGGDGFATGEGATYDVTGTQTEKGSSANAFTYALNEGTLANNYNITKTEGTLTVTAVTEKVTVTITEHSGTAKYDGTEKTVTGYDVSISNPLYTTADFTFSGNATIKGTDAATYNMELKASDFTNTSENFTNVEFVIVDGTLVISKRDVTLTSADDEKVYDGDPLTNSNVTVGGDGFVEGEGATYNVTGSQTNVGESANAFTYALKEGTKAANYNITKTEGTLTVTPVTENVTVRITGHSGTAKYDGTEKTVTGYEVSISNPLYTVNDFTFSGDATIEETNAGTYNMGLASSDFANTSENFTNVEFVVEDGTLEISKRSVTLTSATDSKVYDSTPLTNSTVTVGGDGFVTGEGATYNVTGTQTDAGSSANAFTYTLNEGTLEDNYDITKVEGTLTVTPVTDKVTVTITEHSGTEKYDGTEKTVTGYDVAISNPLYTESDFTFNGDDTVKGTDVGKYDMELEATDFTNISGNFTNVEFVIVDGQLEITKRDVTLTSADDEKVYDGDPLTNDNVTVGGDGWANGEGATYDVTGSQTNVGESANTFAYTLSEATKEANYNITKTEGTLTVTPFTDEITVTITEHSGSATYDGKEHTVTGYDVEISNSLYKESYFTFSGDDTITGKDAGTYDMKLKPEDFTNTSANFTNIKFVIVDGQLVINPAQLPEDPDDPDDPANVRFDVSQPEDVVYNGKEQKQPVTVYDSVTKLDLEEGTDCTITYSEDVTNVGEVTITIEGQGNYSGSFTRTYHITPKPVKVTADDKEKTYGDADPELTATEEGVVEGDTLEYELYREEGEDVGEYVISFRFGDEVQSAMVTTADYRCAMIAVVRAAASQKVVMGNYEVEFIDGTFTIDPAELTITTGSAEKEYDGTPLTNDEATITGLKFDDEATVVATGSQTKVGSSENTYKITWVNGKASNYTIVEDLGTLAVTEAGEDNPTTPSDKPHTGDPSNPLTDGLLAAGAGLALLFARKRRKQKQA